MKRLILTAAAIVLGAALNAQVYSLPSTTVVLEVTAEVETFTAGPYAKYALKYLGGKASSANSSTCTVTSAAIKGVTEADLTEVYPALLSKSALEQLMQLSAQGLVAVPGAQFGKTCWKFEKPCSADPFCTRDLGENLTSVTTTLYKSVKTAGGYDKVAVQQSEVVEKSLEKKASDAAQRIFELRKSRISIVTGDTDATFSGEALPSAIAEINRLEQEYLSLFYGVSEKSQQTMTFEVIPTAANAKQMYVAFRISDTEGLVPPSSTSGRPVILSLSIDGKSNTQAISDAKKKSSYSLWYRIPATVTARLLDGQNTLVISRMPVYQLGEKISISL